MSFPTYTPFDAPLNLETAVRRVAPSPPVQLVAAPPPPQPHVAAAPTRGIAEKSWRKYQKYLKKRAAASTSTTAPLPQWVSVTLIVLAVSVALLFLLILDMMRSQRHLVTLMHATLVAGRGGVLR